MAVKQQSKGSLALTFAIVRFFKRLNGRVGPSARLPEPRRAAALKALTIPDKGLGKLHRKPRERRREPCSNRVRKHRRHELLCKRPPRAGHGLRHVLRCLDSDSNINFSAEPLSAVCSDDNLFLKYDTLRFNTCSLDATAYSFIAVYEAINALHAMRTQFGDSFFTALGWEMGMSIDETFMANYEHLLLRLQTQLMETLTRKAAEALISNDLDKTQRKLLNWFSEFPDSRRPLSTTWPWSIKPSLAVLWGVCWMFYNSPPRIPQALILQEELVRAWNPPQPNEYYDFGLQLLGRDQENEQAAANDNSCTHPSPAEHGGGGQEWEGLDAPSRDRTGDATSRAAQPQLPSQGSDHTGGLGLGAASTRRAYYGESNPQPAASPTAAHATAFSAVPDISGFATQQTLGVFAFSPQLPPHFDEPWSLVYTQSNLPPQSTSHLINPVITVTDGSTQPQSHYSGVEVYQHQQPQDLHLNTHFMSQYTMGRHQQDARSPPIVTQGLPLTRPSSVHSAANMPTPTSLADAPHLSDRGRRHSAASSASAPLAPPSEDSSQVGDDALLSPRSITTYKRSEEPPRDRNGRMICNTCPSKGFDRKCEWSKHMDKHERPYKCSIPGCEKLAGFTYSGGLSRHEREVHNMHGGKKELYCPYQDCKRSSGLAFTRKENRDEHIRRVHRSVSIPTDPGVVLDETAQDVTPKTAAFPAVNSQGANAPSVKRKRTSDAGSYDESDLAATVKRLQEELQARDERIRQLETTIEVLRESRN